MYNNQEPNYVKTQIPTSNWQMSYNPDIWSAKYQTSETSNSAYNYLQPNSFNDYGSAQPNFYYQNFSQRYSSILSQNNQVNYSDVCLGSAKQPETIDSSPDSANESSNNKENTNEDTNKNSAQQQNSQNEVKNNEELLKTSALVNDIPAFFTTQKIQNSAAKLSYTVYQLELLNAIYTDMKYPNSVQKTMIAKLIGITRDQVKIWFQNRRRKDTLVSQGKLPTITKFQSKKRRKSSDDSENTNEEEFDVSNNSSEELSSKQKSVVDNKVIQGVLYQLKAHQNAPSRLNTKRTKLTTPELMIEQKADTCIKQDLSQNQIIDLNSILKNSQIKESLLQSTTHQLNTPKETNYQLDNSAQSSVLTTSSSSTSSSSEEETHDYYKPKFQRLPESVSIKDYVTNKYYTQNYQVYNHYQQPLSYNNNNQSNFQQQQQQSIYQANTTLINSNDQNAWSVPTQSYTPLNIDPVYYYNSNLPYTNNYNNNNYTYYN